MSPVVSAAEWVRIELSVAGQADAEKLARARTDKWDPRVTPHGDMNLGYNLTGALGEVAFCQLLGKPHPNLAGTLDGEIRHDCYGWQVRAASQRRHGLNLHRGDEGRRFVFLLTHERPVIWLAGTIDADKGFEVGRWRKDGHQGDVWWCRVSQGALAPWVFRHGDPLPDGAYWANRVNKFDDPDAVWAEPAPNRYCAPKRCYCGECPSYVPIAQLATNTPERYTIVDRRAVLSSTGRRAGLAEYRQAQAEERNTREGGGR